MTEPRRVRTQVERDADDHAWRRDLIGVRTADGRVYAPEDVQLVYPADRVQDAVPCRGCHACTTDGGELPWPPISYADQLVARHGQPMRDAIDRARVRYEADKAAARQPRRRWWHRLTRALAGRWLHVLTPGFLGELFNDIWSHTRHRLTRRNP